MLLLKDCKVIKRQLVSIIPVETGCKGGTKCERKLDQITIWKKEGSEAIHSEMLCTKSQTDFGGSTPETQYCAMLPSYRFKAFLAAFKKLSSQVCGQIWG